MSKETKSHLERMNHWVIFALIAKASFLSKMLKYRLGLWNWGLEKRRESPFCTPTSPAFPHFPFAHSCAFEEGP